MTSERAKKTLYHQDASPFMHAHVRVLFLQGLLLTVQDLFRFPYLALRIWCVCDLRAMSVPGFPWLCQS